MGPLLWCTLSRPLVKQAKPPAYSHPGEMITCYTTASTSSPSADLAARGCNGVYILVCEPKGDYRLLCRDAFVCKASEPGRIQER
jgi:hypothetical protein